MHDNIRWNLRECRRDFHCNGLRGYMEGGSCKESDAESDKKQRRKWSIVEEAVCHEQACREYKPLDSARFRRYAKIASTKEPPREDQGTWPGRGLPADSASPDGQRP